MRYLKILTLVTLLVASTASADVWRWVDPDGKTHYVDSNKSIFVWRDETGRVIYSDKKDHDNAVLVQLIWHSAGSLADVQGEPGEVAEHDGETEEEKRARLAYEREKEKNCKRAREIYDSYLNAPKLYRSGENGDKEYLSEKEAEEEIAQTKLKVDEVCS